jgi:replicative DNA helicase
MENENINESEKPRQRRVRTIAKNPDRILPHDTDAESAVLSAMMIDAHAVAKAIEILYPRNFYSKKHQIIYQTMCDLFEKVVEVDLITVISKLDENGELTMVGGKTYLNELSDIVLSAANIEYHAKIVLEKALLRDLINASNEIIQMCYESELPPVDIVDRAEQMIFEIAQMPNRKTFVKIGDIINNTRDRIEEISKTKTGVTGVPTGFNELDAKTGGFRKGQLIVVAARPGMGKTSFALNIASHLAYRRKMCVGIFTLEMATEELLLRLISSEAEISMSNLLNGYGMDSKSINTITQVTSEYSAISLFIDDTATNTVMDIRAKCRRLKSEQKALDLIIIDYIQLMNSRKNNENRQQEISEISRGLKILAKELEVPVLALSQLNRGLESREDKRPRLSDLRESGAIEQDADMVMFIFRDEEYTKEKSEHKGIAEVIIGKNRHGATGKVELRFKNSITKFENKTNANDQNF